MADVVIAVTQTAVRTTQGTQDITTTALGGRTPKAALFIVTLGTVNGTAADHASLSVGGTDGTRHYSSSFFSTSGVATSDTQSMQATDTVARVYDTVSTFCMGFFNQWLTNGVRLTWGVAGDPPISVPAAAYLVTVIFFAGDDLSAYCGNATITTTLDTATDITAPGFEPRVVFSSIGSGTGMGIGLAHNDGSGAVTSGASYLRSRNGRATSEIYGQSKMTLSGNPIGAVQCGNAFSSDLNSWLQLSAFDASGFSVTPRSVAALSSAFNYLALAFGDRGSKVWGYATPASTGNADDTGPGFEPAFVWYTETTHPALDTYYTDSNANGLGIAAITAAAQYANCIVDEDNVGTMSSRSMADDDAVHVRSTAATRLIGAIFGSFLSNGVRLNYDPTAARQFIGFALAADAAPAFDLRTHATAKKQELGANSISVNLDTSTGANRVVGVIVRAYRAAGNVEVTSVTVGGQAASKIVGAYEPTDGHLRNEGWWLGNPPEGASVAVVANLSEVADSVEIAAITKLDCAGPGPNTDTQVGNIDAISMALLSQSNRSKLMGAWAGKEGRVVTEGGGVEKVDSL